MKICTGVPEKSNTTWFCFPESVCNFHERIGANYRKTRTKGMVSATALCIWSWQIFLCMQAADNFQFPAASLHWSREWEFVAICFQILWWQHPTFMMRCFFFTEVKWPEHHWREPDVPGCFFVLFERIGSFSMRSHLFLRSHNLFIPYYELKYIHILGFYPKLASSIRDTDIWILNGPGPHGRVKFQIFPLFCFFKPAYQHKIMTEFIVSGCYGIPCGSRKRRIWQCFFLLPEKGLSDDFPTLDLPTMAICGISCSSSGDISPEATFQYFIQRSPFRCRSRQLSRQDLPDPVHEIQKCRFCPRDLPCSATITGLSDFLRIGQCSDRNRLSCLDVNHKNHGIWFLYGKHYLFADLLFKYIIVFFGITTLCQQRKTPADFQSVSRMRSGSHRRSDPLSPGVFLPACWINWIFPH